MKMEVKLTYKLLIKSLACMALLTAGQAQAALVQFTVEGEITFASEGNGFGLSTGTTISASGVFNDDSFIASSSGSYIDFSTIENNMSIVFGDYTYTDIMETYNGAHMLFDNSGVFNGIEYGAIDLPAFDSWGALSSSSDFSGTNNLGDTTVTGNWTNSYAVSAVPVPAAVWLFSTGSVFLVGFARRQSRLKNHNC